MKSRLTKREYTAALTPLKYPKKKLGDFVTFDIETNNWKEFVVGGIYDGTTFTYYKTAKDLLKALLVFRKCKIFAHFGGIFDFLFLINELGVQRILDSDLIMRGSSIFSFKLGSNTFYDSCGILPFSLEKAARAFHVEHQKLDIDHRQIKRITPELLKYLEHDCRALYETIQKFYSSPILQNTNFKPTLASQSLEVLRKYLPCPIPSIEDKEIDRFVREGYAGGRVEIFRPIYEGDTPLYYYDFNSLYPACMHDMDVPGRVDGISKNITPMSFTDCIVESPKDIYLPLLWQKTRSKFTFPKGKWRGTFPGIELLEAEKLGYKIHKVFKSVEFENLGKIFKPYIQDLYTLKNNAPDEVTKQIAKLLLNAGYGRMAIKRERESLCIDNGEAGITPTNIYIGDIRLGKKTALFRGFSHAAIGALVTAHARLKLFHAMRPIESRIYYCDTDSIVTTEKIDTSSELGRLKLEGTTHRACFLLPKTYIFGDGVKMKGFPKEFAQSLNFEDFVDAMEGELRIQAKVAEGLYGSIEEYDSELIDNFKRFKTKIPGKLARIKSAKNNNNSILKVLEDTTRQLRTTYDKRILIKKNGEWDSIPISIN